MAARPRSLVFSTAVALAAGSACTREAPPGASEPGTPAPAVAPNVTGSPTLPEELRPKAATAANAASLGDAGAVASAPHAGPWLAITAPAAAVYSVRDFEQKAKIGYVRNGGRLAVKDKPVVTKSCTAGWHEVIGGGYVCANLGTTDLSHPQVKFGIKPPDLSEVLPYTYARNAKNGTPLYRSVPSHEQMQKYEPYLAEAKAQRAKEKAEKEAQAKQERARDAEERGKPSADGEPEVRAASLPAEAALSEQDGGSSGDGGTEPEKPWWQRPDAKDRLHEITLNKLNEDSDDILAKRMVTGFYIAVDKTFSWNGRTWYKSTKGLIAPAERFWLTAPTKFQGVELDGQKWKLPIAWVYGGRKTAPSWEIDPETKKTKPAKPIEVFTPIQLTGRELDVSGTRYSETQSGVWVKNIFVRITRPGTPPKDLRADERWVDVNLKEQTLVVFQGTQPVFATLVSSGKQSTDKDKDHRTPTGEWRVREKHVTTTMDGDGSAAGDLPYSIEDVPYVVYFDKSYALHGAFWHRNFGVQMSHGCVNLAPLDAKWVFLHTDPPLPDGWHGAWSTADRPGSRIVVHE